MNLFKKSVIASAVSISFSASAAVASAETERPTDISIEDLADKIIANNTSSEDLVLLSQVDGYEYRISREEGDFEDWYIQVNPVDECFLYDGWWSGSDEKTLREAVIEAIDGAGILEEDELDA